MIKKLNKGIFYRAELLLLLIVLFGLFLRLFFFSGMGISDSLVYGKTASDINLGKGIDPESTLTLSTRLGLIYPTAFSYKIFGINDFSSVVFVLLTSLASIVLMFYFGKLLFNEKTGLIAAFLYSFYPLDLVYSTKLLSDLPSAFFVSLGLYLFFYLEIKKIKTWSLYIVSGILIGIGYMIRESALLIALFFIAYIIYKRKIKKKYFLVPIGVLSAVILESLLFLSLTGDILFRFHTSQSYLQEAVIGHNYFGRLDFPLGLFHYPYLILTSNLLNSFYILIFISILYCILKKERKAYPLMLWFIPLLLYLSFGSASLTSYIPFRAVDRYLSIINVAGILLIAFFLYEKRGLFKKFALHLTLSLLLISSVMSLASRNDGDLLDGLRELSPFLKQTSKPIYIDDRSIKVLEYLSSFNSNIDLRVYPKNFEQIKAAYIVINKEMIKNLMEANKNRKFPEEIENPPKDWIKIKEFEDKITIYYIE